jgi:hypothetical protein
MKRAELDELIELCEAALVGELDWAAAGDRNYRERRKATKDPGPDEALRLLVFDDLQDAAEHVPGYLFRRGVNEKQWHRAHQYLAVFADLLALRRLRDGHSAERILACRETVLDEGREDIPTAVLERRFEDCVQAGSKPPSPDAPS